MLCPEEIGQKKVCMLSGRNIEGLATDETTLLRIGFLSAGSFCLYEGFQTWVRGRIETNPQVVWFCVLIYLAAFFLLALTFTTPDLASKLRDVIPISLMAVSLASAYVMFQISYKGAYRTDALAFTHYAADLFLSKGLNPYPVDLQEALHRFAVDPIYITFTPSGDITTALAYPSLHFLIFVPFISLGLNDMRWVLLLFEAVTVATLYMKSPRELKPIILLPIFISADLAIDFNAGAVTDFLWVLPMVWTAFHMKDPFRGGVFYGIACAIKQEPWIVAPFLLIRMLNLRKGSLTVRMCDVLKFAGATLISFVIPNLLFVVKDPIAWFSGVFTPASGALVVLSQGLSMLTQSGIAPLPPAFYLATAIVIFLTLVANYLVYFDKMRHSIWLLPALTMWFSYRALQNYFMYWIPVMVAELLTDNLERRSHEL